MTEPRVYPNRRKALSALLSGGGTGTVGCRCTEIAGRSQPFTAKVWVAMASLGWVRFSAPRVVEITAEGRRIVEEA